MKRTISFTPLADIGSGVAEIDDFSVKIKTSGINGVLKAWLIGNEAYQIGNLVNGRLEKEIDTQNHTGILITQSGRQMLVGYYRKNGETPEEREKPPLKLPNLSWRKITEKRFGEMTDAVKYILCNQSVYDCFKKYGHYWLGKGEDYEIIALPCEKEDNPLKFLGNTYFKNGYAIICVDEKNERIFRPFPESV